MSEELKRLFDSARLTGGVEFIYTLTRVAGMSIGRPDPLLSARDAFDTKVPVSVEARAELLKILANLLRCVRGLSYREHYAGSEHEQTLRLVANARESGYAAIADALEAGGVALDGLLGHLLGEYEHQRRSAKDANRLHKLGGFEVLELLVDDEGLNGFRVHFSNDEHAEFKRTRDSTLPLNLMFDEEGELIFNVGDLSALTAEWRVDGRPLYEVGLDGRYNAPGTWKPLVYPGAWDRYSKLATEASERPEVQGALLYCFLTGHRAIEFAVRTSVELPHDVTSFGQGRVELTKLPPVAGGQMLYDGTVRIASLEADAFEEAFSFIHALMNRIAFAFDAAVNWVPKYSTHHNGRARATPSEDDLQLLDHLLTAGDAGRGVIDQAIDWYNRGRSSSNEFVAFLCAYIAFESTAVAVWGGDIAIPIALSRPAKAERKAEVARCIEALRDLEREGDPGQFIQHAYFECVVPLTRRVKDVASAVFGADSTAASLLFDKREGTSLASLRSSLAHGSLSLADPASRALVRERLPEIQDVVREFLLRVALKLSPDDDAPQWSRLHLFGVTMDDPRATLCTTSLDHLPQSYWWIRPEWVE